ncbi:MAG TPA: NAD(P)H-dependent oxidoreductase subunit E [Gemmataceae bacterium]|jgi:NADH:ubiquinone oxidoreductase subunit F (NADH-binding)/NADH:ubiquinone oxidoreductase subunit E|nr:NAD(P)H-dependent oxidoreductase subunit E [Gemmataceae bacterium]
MIVQRLHEIQNRIGYLPDAELAKVAREANVPLYRVQEVAGFFPHFRQEWNKPPRVELRVCRDMSCHLAGSDKVLKNLTGLAKSGEVAVEGVSCLGRCDRAPACSFTRTDGERSFHDHVYAGRLLDDLRRIADAIIGGNVAPPPDTDQAYTPQGNQAEWQIDVYRNRPELGDRTYRAIKDFLLEHPEPIRGRDPKQHPWLCRLDPAGLLGMGGAGVPAYRKWLDVWQATGDEKFIVCNGDESEPGTFKDREILLRMPHLVVEGVILAGLMTNATAGYIYIRHEYGEQIAAVRAEIDRAIGLMACGSNIFGSGRTFTVEVFVSPGGYICGEQSALIEAMEDKRSQPRNRPPELATNGLRDKPTLVNNVETLAWVPAILLQHDGQKSWYASQGRPGFRGRRLLSISGNLERPGVYEIPIGATLGDLINMAGGVRRKRGLGAVAPSGPSGGLIPPTLPAADGWQDRLKGKSPELATAIREGIRAGGGRFDVRHLPLDLLLFREVGPVLGLRISLMLGAGLVVYDSSVKVMDQALNFTRFFRNESCGKCVPCRIGSQKLVEIGTKLAGGLSPIEREDATADVFDLAYTLGLTSICGLGVVAPNPLTTVLEWFRAPETQADFSID